MGSFLRYAALTLSFAATGCGSKTAGPAPSPQDPSVSVRRAGDTTVVTIEDRQQEPENGTCKAYCERLAACWYAVPNADPMLSQKDVFDKCWAEQHQCRTATTELLCCASIATCGDFVQCQSTGRDVVSDCRHSHRATP